ncbi:predicted protein, partial [Ostreococcus lucimarinus CCE9901]
EVGHLAVWSVASAKPGNGVELLRDDDLATFWQSDGAQPHVVNAQFQHKAELCEIALWCEYKMDESYTPSLISIRAGASCHDLREVRLVELEQPNGWVRVRLRGVDDSSYLRAYFIQIAVLANHQNGRDTHVRQIKIFGPRRDQARALGRSLQLDFQSPAFSQYAGPRAPPRSRPRHVHLSRYGYKVCLSLFRVRLSSEIENHRRVRRDLWISRVLRPPVHGRNDVRIRVRVRLQRLLPIAQRLLDLAEIAKRRVRRERRPHAIPFVVKDSSVDAPRQHRS